MIALIGAVHHRHERWIHRIFVKEIRNWRATASPTATATATEAAGMVAMESWKMRQVLTVEIQKS